MTTLDGFVVSEQRREIAPAAAPAAAAAGAEGFADPAPDARWKWRMTTPEGTTDLRIGARVGQGWAEEDRLQYTFRTDGSLRAPRVQTDVVNLGEKWRLSGVGEAHGNDSWLRVFDKNGKDYSGGVAMAQGWVRDNSYLNGTTTVSGPFDSQGNDARFKGGVSEHNPGGWQTHFPWPGNNQNYIRGDTEMRGNTNNIGDLSVGRNASVAGGLTARGALDVLSGTTVGGSFVVRGPFDAQGNDSRFRGGASEHNPGGWQTHFPWPGDNKNYIRGDTEIRGNTNNIGDITVGRRLCVGGICLTEAELQRLKRRPAERAAQRAAEQARREAEERSRREAEERSRREAEERARRPTFVGQAYTTVVPQPVRSVVNKVVPQPVRSIFQKLFGRR